MQYRQEIDRRHSVVVELPLGDGATCDLEKAVCSHGLFMMAPNHWDSLSKTLERPLRLSENINDDDHEKSHLVRISQPPDSPHSLHLRVFGTDSLSPLHQRSLLVLFVPFVFLKFVRFAFPCIVWFIGWGLLYCLYRVK